MATCLQVVLPQKMQEVQEALGLSELKIEDILNFNKFADKIQHEQFMLFERIKR
ncbi:Uncharacterised protein [Mycoplasmopsis edwardii]|uniref:Uncharacterized protein n=1 Tax=Mycoplasmopsis edwardii TaxID=53558 RepID=A0A3B0PIE4_9BACT|nr:Uncharacterised protein [Mycoplasmopsis edwardii]